MDAAVDPGGRLHCHGFFNRRGDMKDYNQTVKQMDAFLGSLGYLEGEPPDENKQATQSK